MMPMVAPSRVSDLFVGAKPRCGPRCVPTEVQRTATRSPAAITSWTVNFTSGNVLDSALRMSLDCKLVTTAQNDVVVFTVSRDESRITELRNRGVRVEVLPSDAGRVPLDGVLDKLGQEGVLTLLTETGTRLNTAFLAAGLVDRLHLFISPQIMGSDAVPAFRGLPQFIHMNDPEIDRYGNDLGLSSLLRDPWPPANGQ